MQQTEEVRDKVVLVGLSSPVLKKEENADEDTMDYLGQALAAGQLSQWAETASVSRSDSWGSWDDVACCARCEALEFPGV